MGASAVWKTQQFPRFPQFSYNLEAQIPSKQFFLVFVFLIGGNPGCICCRWMYLLLCIVLPVPALLPSSDCGQESSVSLVLLLSDLMSQPVS